MKIASLCVISFWHNTGVWQPDGQTDGFAVTYTAACKASLVARCNNYNLILTHRCVQHIWFAAYWTHTCWWRLTPECEKLGCSYVGWNMTLWLWISEHRMTMTSFDITVYSQCCRRHVVGKPVLSNISIVRSCWGICVLNLTMLICSNRPAGCCTWKVYFASHIKQLGLQHGGM